MGILFNGVKTYRTKVVHRQAIFLTTQSVNDAAAWCGGNVAYESKPSDPDDKVKYLEYPTLDGKKRADLDVYLVKDERGRFYTMPKGEFEQTMEEYRSRGEGISFTTYDTH